MKRQQAATPAPFPKAFEPVRDRLHPLETQTKDHVNKLAVYAANTVLGIITASPYYKVEPRKHGQRAFRLGKLDLPLLGTEATINSLKVNEQRRTGLNRLLHRGEPVTRSASVGFLFPNQEDSRAWCTLGPPYSTLDMAELTGTPSYVPEETRAVDVSIEDIYHNPADYSTEHTKVYFSNLLGSLLVASAVQTVARAQQLPTVGESPPYSQIISTLEQWQAVDGPVTNAVTKEISSRLPLQGLPFPAK